MTFSATLLGVNKSGEIITDLSAADAKTATSLHVLAFSPKRHLLLNESEGRFDLDTWELVRERALSICQELSPPRSDGDVAMSDETDGSRHEGFVREAVEDRLHKDYMWKIDSI